MAKMCLKKPSKRMPAKRRYKIEKRIRQHKKKVRREEKKNPKAKKANKMVVVPNVCPFKEEILKEAEEFKKHDKEERKKAFELAMKRKRENALQQDIEMKEEEGESLESLVQSAQSRQKQHETWDIEEKSPSKESGRGMKGENSLKAYYKEFRKVVDAADVVLEVVDARDPLGTRCIQVEDAVKEAPGNKKLVLVLNKADLVPKEVLTKWLQYLRRTVPAIAFKASTQKQKQNLGRRKLKRKWSEKETNVSPCVGAEVLMSLLNNYCRNKNLKTSIHVGIVGLPNVGKSSIINSLKRSRACEVGSMPGVTRTAQLIELDKKIKLLDSPGIVFATASKGSCASDAATVLKNAVHVQNIADPITPATAILQRASKQQMMTLYNLPEYDTPQEFFVSLAEATGRLMKGGIPDTVMAARQLINDWNRGKIRYYCQPPEVEDESHVSATIVTQAASEFDVDSFKEMETKALENMEDLNLVTEKVSPVVLEPSQPVVAAVTCEEQELIVEETNECNSTENTLVDENVTVVAEKKRRKSERGENKKASNKELLKDKKLMQLEGNQKLNLHKKQSFKKLKKMQNRNARHAASLAGVLENFSLGEPSGDQDYNFDTDFTS